ncbi:protein phosphatase 2C domain-containing protein [Streptomyces sp. FH025]|uniref:protein phosphatase 2C domain-containing protein n=1 Tax=Streptomyces sp. FH025 TaxID=2815937 RepID=UPI001A9D5B30|nr:protein phosphatase 2C domain-containing protein [Streptomyces sp. FH025]MBO1419082.1 protein phosphatase 2C domain-containing protein [Streptomyces sp. FH025]
MRPHGADGTPSLPAPRRSADTGRPWQRIAVGVPGVEFEPRPPRQPSFDFPDTECDGWSTSDLTMRFASVRGAKHRYYQRPRQDAARAALHQPTGIVAFAVADGISNATSSELGAIEACRAALARTLHLLSERPGPLDFQDVAHHAARRLWQVARWRLNGAEPDRAEVSRLYATTLVTGVVRPDPAGPVVELCRIGDSGAWLLDRANGRYHPLFRSGTSSDALLVSNEVTSLPTVPDPVERTGTRLTPQLTLLIGTDGFGDPLGDGDGRVGALFADTLAEPPTPLWLAHVLDFSRETFDDDRTLLAIWPHAARRNR